MYKNLTGRFGDVINKVDDQILKKKIMTTINMIEDGKVDQLKRKVDKMDPDEIKSKLDSFDKKRLSDMKIDVKEISKRITEEDYKKAEMMFGKNGKEIISKIKDLLSWYGKIRR